MTSKQICAKLVTFQLKTFPANSFFLIFFSTINKKWRKQARMLTLEDFIRAVLREQRNEGKEKK